MLASEDYTIEKNPARVAAEDYDLLRSSGLDHIEKLSGKVWTDYNIHDPGVTILELLCYALTDLGYRTSFDISDILTPTGKKGPEMKDAFYSANKILTSHPITANDYRKLIIEKVSGVRNIWFEIKDNEVYIPSIGFDYKNKTNIFVAANSPDALELKGLYKVKVELEDFEIISAVHKNIFKTLINYQSGITKPIDISNYQECYKNYIESILMSHRNICEDFYEVIILNEVSVGICADIELIPEANDEKVLIEIYNKIYEYVNHSIKLYTYQQLLDEGKSIEQIFQGSAVNRGFIDYDELNAFDRKKVLYTSDVINIIMNIEGVLNIRSIQFNTNYSNSNIGNAGKYCLQLPNPDTSSFRFSFDINNVPADRLNKIIFRKGLIYFLATTTQVWKITDVLDFAKDPEKFENDLPLPTGNNRQLDDYISIQDEFPKAYMVGREGISNGASDLRKAQRLQLKAYLLFFDQLLSDYLAQLNSVKDLLSWRNPASESTYNFKQLSENEILDFNELLSDYDKYQLTIEPEKLKKDRRNRLLDHLMARFNEKFVDYTIFKFLQNSEGSSYTKFENDETINNKKDFLKHYPLISGSRSHAVDYTQPISKNNFNILEYRISEALGIHPNKVERYYTPEVINITPSTIYFKDNRNEPFNETFGFHIYEHIIFRPRYDNSLFPNQEFLKLYFGDMAGVSPNLIINDPYSLKATVVVTGWLNISGRMEFRKFVEQKIRMEMPAHVALKICWINPRQMLELEKNYDSFIYQMNKLFDPGNAQNPTAIKAYEKALNNMVNKLSSLSNMYPPSVLDEPFDFITANSKQTPVILDNTTLSGDDPSWAFEMYIPEEKNVSKKVSKINPIKKVKTTGKTKPTKKKINKKVIQKKKKKSLK